MNEHTEKLRQEYSLTLTSYFRTDDGKVTDARPEAAMKWAQTAQDFAPEEIEAADLAAIMSCCTVVDSKACAKLSKCFAELEESDEDALAEARTNASALFQLAHLQVCKGHSAHGYFRKLFESEAGKSLLVDMAICLSMTPKVSKKAVCCAKDLVTADTEVESEVPPTSKSAPRPTKAIQQIPDDPKEAEDLFRQALRPGRKGKAALAVITASPTQALALLNRGELAASTRFQADVLDAVVDGVSQKGMGTEEVKQLLHDHLRPEVLAELLTGRGDLPASAVSYAPLKVVFEAIQEELEEGNDLFRLHYWAVKLVDANYEHYQEFLKSPVQKVRPTLARSQWKIADLLICDLLDREVDGRALLHELTLLRVDTVIDIETLEERIGQLQDDLPDLVAAFHKPDEDDEESDVPSADSEREPDETEEDEDEKEEDKQPRGKTDEAAKDLDLE